MAAYKSNQAMAWLHREHHWAGFEGPEFFDFTHAGRGAVIRFLERVCETMHKRGVRGHWTYSLPLHTAHVRILDAEKAALAAAAEPSRIAA
jgi:hypothetical protein